MNFGHIVSREKNKLYEAYLRKLGKVDSILELGAGDGVNFYGWAKSYVEPGSVIIASYYADKVIAVEIDEAKCRSLKLQLELRGINNVEIHQSDFNNPVWSEYAREVSLVNLDPSSLSNIVDRSRRRISHTIYDIVSSSRKICFTMPLPFRGKRMFNRIFNTRYSSDMSTDSLVKLFSDYFNTSLTCQYRCKPFMRLIKEE
jgi:hypothetical protein